MEKRTKKNLSRMTMIIAAFMLVTAIGIGVWAATQLTRTAGTTVTYSASLGISLKVEAEKYDENDTAWSPDTKQTLTFGAGDKASHRAQNASDSFTLFTIEDEEYVLYTFTFSLKDTKYTDSDNVPYDIDWSGSPSELAISVVSGATSGTVLETNTVVVIKVEGASGTPITAGQINFIATFGN